MYYSSLYENVTRKSPEMLAPARIPVAAGKKMANTEKNVSPSLNSGVKFSKKILAVKRERGEEKWQGLAALCESVGLFVMKNVYRFGADVSHL